MHYLDTLQGFDLFLLEKDVAETYQQQLTELIAQIPLVSYKPEDILAERKENRIFYGKWEHSLVVFDEEKPIAVIMSYERESEQNQQYPENSLYISELAVKKEYQGKGLARKLLQYFFEREKRKGLTYLTGPLIFSIQTNSADWNQHVHKLYESFGFKESATKQYENRTDVVLTWKP